MKTKQIDHEFWDSEIISAKTNSNIVLHKILVLNLHFPHGANWEDIWLTKDDVLTLAKAIGITREDLSK